MARVLRAIGTRGGEGSIGKVFCGVTVMLGEFGCVGRIAGRLRSVRTGSDNGSGVVRFLIGRVA